MVARGIGIFDDVFHVETLLLFQGEWKPKQIDNPAYKGKWVHPEIDNPEYTPDDKLYSYADIGAIGFDLWQVRIVSRLPIIWHVLEKQSFCR